MAREFWSGHPLEEGEDVLMGACLHERVWREGSRYPLDWVLRVVDSIESFCLRYGLDYRNFLEERVLGLNDGCLLSARASLRFAGQYLGALLQSPDIRLTILRILDEASRSVGEGLKARLIRHERSGDHLTAWLLLEVAPYQEDAKASDLCSWIATVLTQMPRRWGAEPFDRVEILADMRSMESIASLTQKASAPELSGSGWWHAGRILSTGITLSGWAESEGLSSQLPKAQDRILVQRVERDWDCPLRGRQVLSRGCILGAPWGLFKIHWDLDDTSPLEGALRALIFEATDVEHSTEWLRADLLQKALLEDDRRRLRFVYHTTDETISCNGTHLLRGVPAKILQKVLIAHTVTGRTLFEHREFRRDPDLNLDPANPNLESRLRLLAERLEERLPVIALQKAGRGRFQLETSVQVEYHEEGNVT